MPTKILVPKLPANYSPEQVRRFSQVVASVLNPLILSSQVNQTAVDGYTVTAAAVTVVDAAGDTTTFPLLGTSATGSLAPVTDAGLTYNALTNTLATTTFVGALTGNASTATALATSRTINGVGFDGTANIVIPVPTTLFTHFADAGNATTAETDLYSDTLAAGQLSANGQTVEAEYAGVFVSSGTATRQVRLYFGGTLIFDSGTLTLSLSSAWTVYVTIIRVSSSVVRCMISMTTEGAALAAYTAYTEVTGLTLANTQVVKITGQAAGIGAASNDIVAKLGKLIWFP